MIAATAALLLASASLALAQGQPAQGQAAQPPAAAAAPSGWTGTFDVGFRGNSIDGDEARFERYRDMRNGANVNFQFGRQTDRWALEVGARNVGYRDGSYHVTYRNSRLRVNLLFDQLPLNYGYYTRTPWTINEGETVTMTLPDDYQARAQANYQLGIPTTAATMANGSIYSAIANPFDVQSRRDTIGVGLAYELNESLEAEVGVRSHSRTGNMPMGAAFAFTNAAELAVPLDDRTTDVEAGLQWASDRGMFRVGWEGSWYKNEFHDLLWDNPLRLTDYNQNRTTVTGFDPNGYNNQNGAALGRMPLAPDNTMQVVSALGMAKLTRTTSVNGNVALIWMNQDDTIIPWTTNPVVANPAVYALFPGLTQLPRSTAEAEVRASNVGLNLRSRPHRLVNLSARYRYASHDNRTPVWDATNNVRFDAVPEDVPGFETEPYKITNNKLDLDASFSVLPRTSLRVGYGYGKMSKTYLVWRDLTDNTVRASVDTIGTEYLTLRAQVERTWRRGDNFHAEALANAGAQPASRLFDDAERTRTRATVMAVFTPLPILDITGSIMTGKDDYDDPQQQFGLLESTNTGWGLGVNVSPNEMVSFGADFAREKYGTFQRSRNANPAPDPSWTDANRNWEMDNDQDTNNLGLYLDLNRALARTDIRFGYDYTDSGNVFDYGGPRIAGLSAANQFIALPTIDFKWHRATFDVRYHINEQVGVGAGYWFEKFEENNDWATIDSLGPQGIRPETGAARIDWLGALTTGYGVRPYQAHTGFLRVFYTF
jgi:MtrB/PioB family decaheme-associated outer membrane protein